MKRCRLGLQLKENGGVHAPAGCSLPKSGQYSVGHIMAYAGSEEFHGVRDRSMVQSTLADVSGPTALRGQDVLSMNSMLSSRAVGAECGGSSGVGRAVAFIEAPAKVAEDDGASPVEPVETLPKKGSEVEATATVKEHVSPISFEQLMSMARLRLSELKCQRMQNTVEDVPHMADDIFPLPRPLPLDPWPRSKLASADMIYGLNLYACGQGDGSRPKREPGGLVENLGRLCERFNVWDEPVDELNFRNFFAKRGVTYDGEEVRVAQTLTWNGVRGSLPDEVGRLELRDFCTQGTLHYIDHFEEHLIDTSHMTCPRAPRVMVGDDWPSICEGLIEKKICEVTPIDQLYHIGQAPLLNGMFGVGKGEFVGEVQTQRLIMNLIPLNQLCEPLVGDVVTLPNISGFGTFLLDEGEVALISSEDVRCFFYLFKVPPEWKKFLGFNKHVPESLVPERWRDRPCVLTACVLPMGFVNSVSIAQHVHRNIVAWSQQTAGGLGGEAEMRKDRASSQSKTQYRVYLDNFDLVERLDPPTAQALSGQVAGVVQNLRDQ